MGTRGLGSCGVVVVWSREGERRPKKPKHAMTAAELAALVATLQVYTADEVDTPAHPDSASALEPVYPDSLFTAGVSGTVTAEFVVDTTGDVLIDTFGVLSSTHPEFTAAVRNALVRASYVPATLAGRPVKQVVHQPFTFVADSAAARRSRNR
jgi:protein TonB